MKQKRQNNQPLSNSIILCLGLAVSGFSQTASAVTTSSWTYAVLTPSVSTTSASAELIMGGGSYLIGQLITLPAVGGIAAGTYYIISVSGGTTIQVSAEPGGTPLTATITESGTATCMFDWADASRWSPEVPDSHGEIAAFPNVDMAGAGNISVSGSHTIHGFNFTGSGSQNVDLTINGGANGTSVGVLNFATDDSSTPMVTMDGTGASRLVNFGGTRPINFSGNQGLIFRGAIGTVTGTGLAATATNPTKQIRLANVLWTGHSGGVTIDRGEVQIQNNDQLPTAQDLAIGSDYSSANGRIAVLSLGAKNQKVGNLNGNEWGRVRASGTLTVGNGDATGGNFGGIVGQDMAGAATSTNLTKTGAGAQTISGPIRGGGSVTASGAGGTLILSGDNSYTGETVVSAGTLALAHANAIAGSSNLRIAGSATFDNTSGAPIAFSGGLLMNSGSPTFTGTSELTFAGASNIGGGVTRTITVTGGTLTLAGILGETAGIATSGSLTKAGGGTLVLSNANTYTGLTSLNAGILKIGNAAALGGSTVNAEVTTTEASTSATAVAVQNLSVGQLVTGANLPANTKITAISGTTLTLSQAATGTGTTPATFEGMTDINPGGTLDLNGLTIAEPFTGLDGAGEGGIGALINSDADNPAQLVNDVANIGSFTIGGDGDLMASRFIGTSVPRTLAKIGAGTVTTHGSGHNNLVAWVVENGTVVLANTSGFGADRGVTINGGALRLSGANSNLINNDQSFTMNGGVFELNGKSEAIASVGGTGGTIRNTAASSISTLFVGGGPGGSSSASFAGVIEDGTGTLGLTKEGGGTQTLTGTLDYSGDTTVSGGSLSINSASLNNASTVAIASGAVLDLTHGAIDDVAMLKFNNVAQPAGTYDSGNSGGYITGSGSIRVVAGYSGWAGANAGNQAANSDYDNDGTGNGIEYFMNSAAGFTANPGLVGGSVTWTNGGNIPSTAYGTQFVVQTSSDLVNWTNVAGGDTNLNNASGSVTYTLTGTGRSFVRLVVAPN